MNAIEQPCWGLVLLLFYYYLLLFLDSTVSNCSIKIHINYLILTSLKLFIHEYGSLWKTIYLSET